MRILLILNICSALTTSPYLGTVGLTSWDRSATPVLEYRKRFAKRGPGLALFGGSDNILKRKNKNYIRVRGTLFLKRKSIECVKDHQLSLLWLPAISTVIAIQNANCQPFSFVFKLFLCHVRRSPRSIPLRPNQKGNLKLIFWKPNQGNEDTKDELMKMTRVKYCSDNYDQEHSFCMDQMGY